MNERELTQNTRILVLGGGLGGLYAALHLDKNFVAYPNVEVTLVSRENYLTVRDIESLHEHLTHLRQNALQPDPEEIVPIEPLTNERVPYDSLRRHAIFNYESI
jgi:heterodisulfide reductase subunit A-like polyferredoxin